VWHWLPRLGPLFDETPINEGNYHESEWFTPLMQINDRFGFIIWPTVGILAVVAIGWAVLKSATHQSIPGEQRTRIKKEIITELRRQLQGMSIEQLAALVNQPKTPLHDLVLEMVKDGMLRENVNSKGATVYKVPGT